VRFLPRWVFDKNPPLTSFQTFTLKTFYKFGGLEHRRKPRKTQQSRKVFFTFIKPFKALKTKIIYV